MEESQQAKSSLCAWRTEILCSGYVPKSCFDIHMTLNTGCDTTDSTASVLCINCFCLFVSLFVCFCCEHIHPQCFLIFCRTNSASASPTHCPELTSEFYDIVYINFRKFKFNSSF